MEQLAGSIRIALLDGDTARRARTRAWLEAQGALVVEVSDPESTTDAIDLICVEAARVASTTQTLRSRGVDAPVIAFVGGTDGAIDALRAGAYDTICEPLDRERVEVAVRRARERQELARRVKALQSELEKNGGDEIVPLRELERRAIEKALHATRGSVEKAARMLGMGRATLYRRLATMGATRVA